MANRPESRLISMGSLRRKIVRRQPTSARGDTLGDETPGGDMYFLASWAGSLPGERLARTPSPANTQTQRLVDDG